MLRDKSGASDLAICELCPERVSQQNLQAWSIEGRQAQAAHCPDVGIDVQGCEEQERCPDGVRGLCITTALRCQASTPARLPPCCLATRLLRLLVRIWH